MYPTSKHYLYISFWITYTFFFITSSTQAQWNPDAGYIPSLTIGKTPIPSSGTDPLNGIDGSTHNHWTSAAPLPQGYISRVDQNNLMGTAAILCTHSGISNIEEITDGSLSSNTTVPLDGNGQAWIQFNFTSSQEILLFSIKGNTNTDIEIYTNNGSGNTLLSTYSPTENYSTKRIDLGSAVNSIRFQSSDPFTLFEIAALFDTPKEYYAVDLEAIEEIGFVHTKHWAGSGDGSGAATEAALYLSSDNINWTKIADLDPTTLGHIQTRVNPAMNARYIKVEYGVVPNDWNKVFLFELAAYDTNNIYGPPPSPTQGTKSLAELMGINGIWGWGHSSYSNLLDPGEGPDLHNTYASHARNYHNMNWDVTDPDNTPDYVTMANGGGTEAQWWLNWDQEYIPWNDAGLEVETSIMFASYINDWDTPFQSAYNYGYAFAEHFGETSGNGLVKSMEIGNEPWFYGATLYNDILRGMASGAKDADPNMLVFPCALQSHDPFAEEANSFFKNYLGARVLESDAVFLDGINVHNYSYTNLDDGGGNGTRIAVHPEHKESSMREIFSALRFRNQNMPGKKVFLSEWGWDFPGPNSDCTHSECVSKEAAAYYSVRAALHYMRTGVDRMTWFFYADAEASGSSLYTRSGMTESADYNFAKKTTFYAFEAMKNKLGDRYFVDVVQEDEQAYIYALGDATGNITHYVAWKPIDGDDTTVETISFDSGAMPPLNAYHIKGLNATGTAAPLPAFSGNNITANLSTVPLVIEVGDVLPVELIDFNAICENETIKIHWSTASELNSDRFELYRRDGKIDSFWEKIDQIKGKGNSDILNHYSSTDASDSAVNYYRLKQIDFDGTSNFSQTIVISNCNKRTILVSPNPATTFINITGTDELDTKIKLFNGSGKLMFEKQNTNTIDINHLEVGVYYIEITDNNGSQFLIEKIVVEK